MATPLQAYEHQLAMMEVLSGVDISRIEKPETLAQFFLCQMQGIKFLQAYCLAQDGVCVIWDSQK